MESCKIANLTNQKSPRFMFTIERDILLLESAIGVNPFQLGREKWADVSEDLRRKYSYMVSARTLRERVDTLIRKFKRDELKSKTGTEEQKSKRGALLIEITTILECEQTSINTELGADDCEENKEDENRQGSAAKAKKLTERETANKERETALRETYIDAPAEPNALRRKRFKTGMEKDLIATKLQHDMDLESQRFKLEAEIKKEAMQNETKRIELEFVREKRLAEERITTQELMRGMQQTLQMVMELQKK